MGRDKTHLAATIRRLLPLLDSAGTG